MKRVGLLLLVNIMCWQTTFSQTVSISDTAFLHALIDLGVDTNNDNQISLEEAQKTVSHFRMR